MLNKDAKAIIIDDKKEFKNLGSIKEKDIHTVELTNYGKERYPNQSIFKKINYLYPYNVPVYVLTKLNNIVFLNLGNKKGILYLNDNYLDYIESIEELVLFFNDYYIVIEYNLYLDDGLVNGIDYYPSKEESAIESFKNFLGRKK